jgi:hypothetical protein
MALKNICPLVQQARLEAHAIMDTLTALDRQLVDTANGKIVPIAYNSYAIGLHMDRLRGYVQLVYNARDAGAYRGRT